HPTGGGEEEQPVAVGAVEVELTMLELLENDAAMAVTDRLRQPGRPGGEQDPERVIEWHLLELEPARRHLRVAQQVIPQHRVLVERAAILPVQIGQINDALERAEL